MKYGSSSHPNSYSQDYNNNNNSNYNNFKNNNSVNRNQATTATANTNRTNSNLYQNPTQRTNFQQQYYNSNNPSNASNLAKQYSQNDNYTNSNNQRMNNNRTKPSLTHTNSLDHSYQFYNNQYHNSQNFNQPPPPPPTTSFLAQPTSSIQPSVQNRNHNNYFHHPNNNNNFNNKIPYNLANSSGSNQFNSQPIPQHSLQMGIVTQINTKQTPSNHFKVQATQTNSFTMPNPSSSPVSPNAGSLSTSVLKDSTDKSQETNAKNNITNIVNGNEATSSDTNKQSKDEKFKSSSISQNCNEEDATLTNDESTEKSCSSTDDNSQLASPSSPLKSSNSNKDEESDDEMNLNVSARVPSPIDDIFDSRYPLHTTWTFWYFKHDATSTKDWESNLKSLMDVSFVDEFWSVLNTIFFNNGFMKNCDFMLFKKGIRPMWEDENNKNGGSWLYHMNQLQHNKNNPNDYINKNLDPMYNNWIHTLLEVIGDNFCGGEIESNPLEQQNVNEFEEHICKYISGVYLSNKKAKKVSLWITDYKNEKLTRYIGRKWKSLLKLSEYVTFTFEVI
jgi:translation initiation factor 4E